MASLIFQTRLHHPRPLSPPRSGPGSQSRRRVLALTVDLIHFHLVGKVLGSDVTVSAFVPAFSDCAGPLMGDIIKVNLLMVSGTQQIWSWMTGL